jgi:hypothetical protein
MNANASPAVEHTLSLIVEAMELMLKNQEVITTRLDNLDEFVTRLDEDLQVLETAVYNGERQDSDEAEWYCEWVAQDGAPARPRWTEIMDKNHDLSPVIYRYSRYGVRDMFGSFYKGEIDNLGGVAYAFQIDYVTNEVYAGVSVCRRDDNFDKALGRGIARKRMDREPITFGYNGEGTLIKSFWTRVYEMYYADDRDTLIDTLFAIDTTDFVTGTVDQ